MFSDTHFHLDNTMNRGGDILSALSLMASRDCFFSMDIGTHCDDLSFRIQSATSVINKIEDISLREKATQMLKFSAGIWPAPEAIAERYEQVKILEKEILNAPANKICALGECGLDHHWNPSGEDNRCEDDFASKKMLDAEAEMFEMQLALAHKLNLPVIVHSRDAFDGTLSCIKNVGYDNGIIHCYSYGINEARAFLDRGWYISFSGSVTYTKKSRMEEISELLNYIPKDRILLETDSPYLAPVPYRGQVNTPYLVEYVYKYVSEILQITSEQLSLIVDGNIRCLFNL